MPMLSQHAYQIPPTFNTYTHHPQVLQASYFDRASRSFAKTGFQNAWKPLKNNWFFNIFNIWYFPMFKLSFICFNMLQDAPSMAQHARKMAHLGAILAHLGLTLAQLGPILSQLGPILCQLGSISSQLGFILVQDAPKMPKVSQLGFILNPSRAQKP